MTSEDTNHVKHCARCGRIIEWRRKWANQWAAVRYCSNACRSAKLTRMDRALETKIIELLKTRSVAATLCPSEAAKAIAGCDNTGSWRSLMEQTRHAARRLVAKNMIDIIQNGRRIDPSSAKGSIRLRLLR